MAVECLRGTFDVASLNSQESVQSTVFCGSSPVVFLFNNTYSVCIIMFSLTVYMCFLLLLILYIVSVTTYIQLCSINKYKHTPKWKVIELKFKA